LLIVATSIISHLGVAETAGRKRGVRAVEYQS
jgi:hypothetical protein